MKRTHQIVIMLAVIIGMLFLSVRFTGINLSQGGVLADVEREAHYGPSDKVLLEYDLEDGRGIVIGKCGNRGLSIARTQNIGGLFYRNEVTDGDDYYGFMESTHCIDVIQNEEFDMIFGIADVDEAVPVSITLTNVNSEEVTIPLKTDENGFFYKTNISEDLAPDHSGKLYFDVFAEYTAYGKDGEHTYNSEMVKGISLLPESYEADTAYPVDWSFLMEADNGELDISVINKINQIMEPITKNGSKLDFNPNMMYCFLGLSEWEPKLSEILSIFPVNMDNITEKMWDVIESTDDWKRVFSSNEDSDAQSKNISRQVHVYDATTVRETVRYYTDLDADKLDSADVYYIDDLDVYWTLESVRGPISFKATSGYKENGYVYLYSVEDYDHMSELRLAKKGNRYVISYEDDVNNAPSGNW